MPCEIYATYDPRSKLYEVVLKDSKRDALKFYRACNRGQRDVLPPSHKWEYLKANNIRIIQIGDSSNFRFGSAGAGAFYGNFKSTEPTSKGWLRDFVAALETKHKMVGAVDNYNKLVKQAEDLEAKALADLAMVRSTSTTKNR